MTQRNIYWEYLHEYYSWLSFVISINHHRDPSSLYYPTISTLYARRSLQEQNPRVYLDGLGGPTQTGGGGAIEDDEGSLEGDVAEDVDADAGGALDAAEAGGAAGGDGAVVDDLAGDGDAGGADAEGEAGRGGAAGEDVAAVRVAVGRAADLLVVRADDRGRQVQQGRAGVGDAVDGGRHERAGPDRVAGRLPLPEALGG